MTTNPYLLPQVIESAAASYPANTAVRCGDRELSYEQLAQRSGELASALLARGIESGQPVGIHMAKSLDAVVAIHGIQRAGCISVPIDPLTPPAVVATTTATIGIAALIVDVPRAAKLASHADRPPLFGSAVDGDDDVVGWDEIAEHDAAPMPDVTSDDAAYMIMTSGSTGAPKAIVHTHRSALRYAQLAADLYGLGPSDRLASIAPFHFDISTFDLYAGPVGRSTSILFPEPLVKFPADPSALAERERVTVWYSVPTILSQMLHRGALDERDLSSLRWVLFGGEVFAAGTHGALMAKLPSARFSNVYGPAEVNQCTYYHLDRPPEPDSSVPIGRPWGDTEVRVIDDSGRIVTGPGTGELYVRTSTMMARYWDRPDLTDASVTTETTAGGLLKRWYQTGDLVERDLDDQLHSWAGSTDRSRFEATGSSSKP